MKEEVNRVNASVYVAILARKCKVHWPMHVQVGMVDRMVEVAEDTGSQLDMVMQLMLHRWEEHKKAENRLLWAYKKPENFFFSAIWDDATQWPWKDSGPKEPGITKQENPHTKEFVEWRDKWREEHGLPKL